MLLTEPPLNPRSNRDTAAQILFETFNVPALYTSIQAVLSLYASGRTTGIVLDAGDGVSHAVPVYEGFSMTSSIRRIDVAGRDVTEYMQTLLRKAGYVFHTSAEKEVVRMIKEKVSYVAADPKREEKEWASTKIGDGKVVEYVLPDGNKIKVNFRSICAGINTLTEGRLALNVSAPLKSSSIPRSSASNTQESTKLSWMQSTAQILTYGNRSLAISSCPVAVR